MIPRRIGAIVLAAGASTRMGRPKQLLRLGGKALVCRAAGAAVEAGCRPVVVVTGAFAAEVEAELSDLPISIVRNERWSAGMGSSLKAGAAAVLAADPEVAGVVVLLCDQPYLTAAVIERLVTAWEMGGKPNAASGYNGAAGPPCCFGGPALERFIDLPDDAGAKRILESDPAAVCIVPWEDGRFDVDTADDWAEIAALHGNRSQPGS
jgi:molybdenum cofactor cytidylyltransferase